MNALLKVIPLSYYHLHKPTIRNTKVIWLHTITTLCTMFLLFEGIPLGKF